MDVVEAEKEYFGKMLAAVPDMKVLLLDAETTGILSMVYSKTDAMEQEVYLFERLDNTSRDAMMHLKALCILRPTRSNLALLRDEFADPKYSEYHLYFTNVLSNSQLKELAEADEHEMVQQVHEFFPDYYPIYRCAFSFNIASTESIDPELHQLTLGRICDGLSAVLLSLRRKPLIRFQKSSSMCQRIAQEMGRRMNTERGLYDFPRTEQNTVLLVVDRKEDPVTPLLTQWTYQAMVHEIFGIENNRVRMPPSKAKPSDDGSAGSSGGSASETDKSPDEIVLSFDQDDFYRDNMFLNWGELGANVKKALQMVQSKEQSSRQLKSIDDMKDFMANFPEFNRMKGNVAKHVKLLGDLLDTVQRRSLMDVSRVEQKLVCEGDFNSLTAEMHEILREPKVAAKDKLRLVMLYALRFETEEGNEITRMCQILLACDMSKQQVGLVKALLSMCGRKKRAEDIFGQDRSWTEQLGAKLATGLKGVENIYTQHKPLLNRIIAELCQGQLRENLYPILGGGLGKGGGTLARDVLVFVNGGATYEEIYNVHCMNQNPAQFGLPGGVRVIIGGTTIHNSKSFLREVAKVRDFESVSQYE